jgi:hypothetical protein
MASLQMPRRAPNPVGHFSESEIDHFVMAITSADATPELVLLLVALGGMTAAATWAVIELKKRRR